MELFDANGTTWKIQAQTLSYNSNDRIKSYENYKNNVSELPCELRPDARIGTESTMAQVFRVQIPINSKLENKISLAAKILPIYTSESMKNNENEMKIAIEASQLVLDKKSKYFPIVYNIENIILCKDTYFYSHEGYSKKWYEKSKSFQQFKFLFDAYKDKKKIYDKILHYKRNFKSPTEIISFMKLKDFKDKCLDLSLPNNVESHILISELATCDLGYYLNNIMSTDFEFYYNILKQVFEAISDMHTKLNVCHRDLHLGNLLVLDFPNSYPVILIHDFGKSKYSNFETYSDKVMDILYFLGQIQDAKNLETSYKIPEKINQYLNEIPDILDYSKEKYPIVDVVNFWNKITF